MFVLRDGCPPITCEEVVTDLTNRYSQAFGGGIRQCLPLQFCTNHSIFATTCRHYLEIHCLRGLLTEECTRNGVYGALPARNRCTHRVSATYIVSVNVENVVRAVISWSRKRRNQHSTLRMRRRDGQVKCSGDSLKAIKSAEIESGQRLTMALIFKVVRMESKWRGQLW
jgi:hypothetical protein